ncbi:heat-inducible transcriptional repressor HrcA [Fusibacter tunisiensis]|uniref:Heat-inducible transcription repressor HrcA n=1 Tax=Fusibacter tunisiensis TaxID=1008308 RepID=A0ABS2MMV1_9FIRM|nr:heat-inducible transcriptional repressor HrcA [Fusibacter tunisiensis]MBM7560721.1 heat-inducible transcriptional repressor [Fusibacter tunisiensis]
MISERQLRILEAIISDFIDTAQPVGSRTISKKYPLGISSATIRNEMADLEELGYLVQPHTSAGRIPSDLGYRLYVDAIVNEHTIGLQEKEMIQSLLLNRIIEANDLAKQASKLLSEFTGLVSIVTIPKFNKCKLANLKLIKVTDSRVLLILVTNTGIVKNIQLAISNADQFILDRISDTMLSFLEGETIEKIDIRSIMRLKDKLQGLGTFVDYLIPILRDALKSLNGTELFVEGLAQILSIQEFANTEKAKTIFEYLKDPDNMELLIEELSSDQLSIKIGSEIKNPILDACSIVSSSYKVDGKSDGKIIVIGSKRMDYGNVVSVVNYISNTLSDVFSGINL